MSREKHVFLIYIPLMFVLMTGAPGSFGGVGWVTLDKWKKIWCENLSGMMNHNSSHVISYFVSNDIRHVVHSSHSRSTLVSFCHVLGYGQREPYSTTAKIRIKHDISPMMVHMCAQIWQLVECCSETLHGRLPKTTSWYGTRCRGGDILRFHQKHGQ